MDYSIEFASSIDSEEIASLAIALTNEIMFKTGTNHFDVRFENTRKLVEFSIQTRMYQVIVARSNADRTVIGFASLCRSFALYAGGEFGIIQEFYIKPDYRALGIGSRIVGEAISYAREKGWVRLELCTPPQPEFDGTIAFYSTNGFQVTGGRKMKLELVP